MTTEKKYEISRQTHRSIRRRAKKEANYPESVINASLVFGSDEYFEAAANTVGAAQSQIALGPGYPTKEAAAHAAEDFGHRAVRAIKKSLSRHFGDYSKYDASGTIRNPGYLR